MQSHRTSSELKFEEVFAAFLASLARSSHPLAGPPAEVSHQRASLPLGLPTSAHGPSNPCHKPDRPDRIVVVVIIMIIIIIIIIMTIAWSWSWSSSSPKKIVSRFASPTHQQGVGQFEKKRWFQSNFWNTQIHLALSIFPLYWIIQPKHPRSFVDICFFSPT